MAVTKIPARDFTIEIDSGVPGPPAWTPIGGLNSLTPSPSTNRADTTDFDSNGVAEHLVMERGLEFTVAGHHLEDALTGDRANRAIAAPSEASSASVGFSGAPMPGMAIAPSTGIEFGGGGSGSSICL